MTDFEDDFGLTLGMHDDDEPLWKRGGLRAAPSPPSVPPWIFPVPPTHDPVAKVADPDFPWCDALAIKALAYYVGAKTSSRDRPRVAALRTLLEELPRAAGKPSILQHFYNQLYTWAYADSGLPRTQPHAPLAVELAAPPGSAVHWRRKYTLFDVRNRVPGKPATWPPCGGRTLVSGGGGGDAVAGTKRRRRATESPPPARRSRRLAGLPPLAA